MTETYNYLPAAWAKAKAEAKTYLASLASQKAEKVVYYSDLVKEIKAIRFHHREHAFHMLLDQLSREGHENGRGMLSSLVVNKEFSRPGAGFYILARDLDLPIVDEDQFWSEEFRKVRRAYAK